MNLKASQTDMVHGLFVRTADENYIAARWCADNQLDTDFFWLAVHALEKYLKAVLLLNGGSSKGYGHDIVSLYANVSSIGQQLLPSDLLQPPNLEISWHTRSAEDFVAHLFRQGNADNRYLIFGYIMDSQDVHMLDQMVFAIRRLICRLDDRVFPDHLAGAPTFTHREELIRDPAYRGHLRMPLDDLISAKENSPMRTAALNLNTAFAPPDFPHTGVAARFSMRSAVIDRRLLDPLESDDASLAAEGLKAAKWFLANVQVPKGVGNQIRAAMKAAMTKHGLP